MANATVLFSMLLTRRSRPPVLKWTQFRGTLQPGTVRTEEVSPQLNLFFKRQLSYIPLMERIGPCDIHTMVITFSLSTSMIQCSA